MKRIALFLAGLVILGAAGFILVEGLSPLDALYLTVATITTVGYGDLVPVSPAGKVFSAFLMLGGVSTGFYFLGLIGAAVADGRFTGFFGGHRMQHRIENLSDHFIVCGYGRVGEGIARELAASGAPLVVIERDTDKANAAREAGHLVVQGDATEEAVLERVHVETARGLATVISDDAENLYITLSARTLNANLQISARSSHGRSGRLLRKAGANDVILLDDLGAYRFARSLLHREAVSLVDELLSGGGLTHGLAVLDLDELPGMAGRSLRDLDLRGAFGIQVVSLKRDGAYVPDLEPGEKLRDGDSLIVIARGDGLRAVRERFA